MIGIRKITLAVVASLAVSACTRGAPPVADTAADQVAIRAAHRALHDAYYANDIDAEMAFYADDAVVMAPDAPAVSGRDAIRQLWMKDVPKPGDSEVLDEQHVEVSGNVGWSSGTFKVTAAGGAESASGKFMSTWRKTNGKWLHVQEIWNNDHPVATASPTK